MGGDKAPRQIVRGCVDAAHGLDTVDAIIMVGDEAAIATELKLYKALNTPKLSVVHTTQVIGMDEHPAQAIRAKKDSSMNRGIELLKEGKADAFVSAGNTGALVASAVLGLRRIPGVKRPALGTVFPTLNFRRPLFILDVGATPDCTEVELEQFAIMGSIYSNTILRQEKPHVGLLSIGTEDFKGNDITKKTFEVLSKLDSIEFKGNVEGHDLFEGHTDVVVTDGFVGNVVLKTTESVARTIGHWMKHEFTCGPIRMLGALCLSGAMLSMKKKMDPELYGGAPLLGINGTVIKTHGSSKKKAIYHAIRVGAEAVNARINAQIAENLKKTL